VKKFVVAVLLLLVVAPLLAAKEHVAERYDIRAEVRPDGSLDVVEEIAFRFTGGEFTYVTRELPADETDGVEVLSASMDGRELPWGDDEGQIEVDYRRRRVRLRWHFEPVRDSTHVFTLRYRRAGVIQHGNGEDWFRWLPFPTRFDYPVERGSVRISWMPEASLLRQPGVDGPAASMSPLGNGYEVTVSDYRQRGEDVLLTTRFMPGTFRTAEPQWQRDGRRADQMSTAFMAGAGMIAAATILALLIFFLKFKRDRHETIGPGQTVTAPPDGLPPALAGSIVHGRAATAGAQLLAVVFDLAGRGAIAIEEQPASGVRRKTRFVVRRGHAVALAPHEQFVMDGLFKNANDGAAPRLDKAMRTLVTKVGPFGKAVKSELAGMGFIDHERADGAKGLMISGGVVMALALVIAMVLVVTNLRVGEASLLVPGAFFASGLTMLLVGAGFSTLTSRGAASAARWAAYRRHLKSQLRETRLPATEAETSRLLPFAASLGLGYAWQKALKKSPGAAVPAWLGTLHEGGGHAALIVLMSSTSSSTGVGGGSSSGVGGGGSSSAG
jgi:hypothetical protein